MKKQQDVRLTERQVQQLMKSMTPAKRKAFKKQQKMAEADRMWDAMCDGMFFWEDDE